MLYKCNLIELIKSKLHCYSPYEWAVLLFASGGDEWGYCALAFFEQKLVVLVQRFQEEVGYHLAPALINYETIS